ncbi:peptidylprolyl isomerase [Flavobacterium sp. CYK-55]|uniref:peptidylprolyl isomerase n=1 Tax=Flavobacterium sp. CYK-55 TaxID=2835529 RepID=UPI001BD18D00|nr:peptidylprolyl isomerase [Flavobacterium sp. CYK-55]MBS7786973.1 peptidylprolyl isomerase [Flavobacterium sp. CYK-55]
MKFKLASIILLLIAFLLVNCTQKENFNLAWTREQAPEYFKAKFETHQGDFEIEVTRKLSPKAADRFYQLVKHHYFDKGIFYRVVPGFVAQFGRTDNALIEQWRAVKIPDEPVVSGNQKGSISFARAGKETRDVEVFINLENNTVLDTLQYEGVRGFPSFGRVTRGMDIVEKLYSGYGESTMNNPNMYTNPEAFYQKFPKLDLIKKAYIIK